MYDYGFGRVGSIGLGAGGKRGGVGRREEAGRATGLTRKSKLVGCRE